MNELFILDSNDKNKFNEAGVEGGEIDSLLTSIFGGARVLYVRAALLTDQEAASKDKLGGQVAKELEDGRKLRVIASRSPWGKRNQE